jgi:hypothetical protein
VYNDAGVQGCCCAGLATNQGRRQPPQESPPEHWPRKKNGQCQRLILIGGFCQRCGYCLCGGCEGATGQRHAKTSQRDRRKTVPRWIPGCSCCDGEETSGSENETRLEAAGSPGWVAAGATIAPGSGGPPWHLGLPGVASTAVHALRRAHGDDLLSLPDLEGEGVGSPAEHGIGAVVEGVEKRNHAALPDPDKAGIVEISRKLAGQLATQIVPGQRKCKSIQRLF